MSPEGAFVACCSGKNQTTNHVNSALFLWSWDICGAGLTDVQLCKLGA